MKSESTDSGTSDSNVDLSPVSTSRFIQCAWLSHLLLFLSFPPVGWWPLAWVAPIPLLYLTTLSKLPGNGSKWWKRPMVLIWLSGLSYWLGTFYFVPLPHPALWAGWAVISSYLAFYTLLFFVVTRVLIHHWRVPIVIAAPVVWTGLEYIRMHFLTGQGLVALSHSQYQRTTLIQCADLSGAYTLTFVIICFAAALLHLPILTKVFPRKTQIYSLLLGPVLLGVIIGYGWYAQSIEATEHAETTADIGIIQGSIDTRLSAKAEVQLEKFEQYSRLTWEARKKWPDLDLVLWPENGLPSDVFDVKSESEEEDQIRFAQNSAADLRECSRIATGVPFQFSEPIEIVLGGLSIDDENNYYNAALHLDESGLVSNRYYKIHRVMYGEYYPILNAIPGIKERLPEMAKGEKANSFEVKGLKLAPLICFETTVPHLVRKQLNQLEADGERVSAILNLTNDGWFFGTSCLDFHLACNVFRAVEMRVPNIVCANTGFSAEINRNGRMVQVGPRRDLKIMKATVTASHRFSLYRKIGDIIPLCFAIVVPVTILAARFSNSPATQAAGSV